MKYRLAAAVAILSVFAVATNAEGQEGCYDCYLAGPSQTLCHDANSFGAANCTDTENGIFMFFCELSGPVQACGTRTLDVSGQLVVPAGEIGRVTDWAAAMLAVDGDGTVRRACDRGVVQFGTAPEETPQLIIF